MNTPSMDQAGIYTDLAGLQKIKQLPKGESEEALRAVAKQFESIFTNMMLKGMREASAVFENDDFTSSNESRFYRDMMDNQLAVSMSQGQGLGLTEALVRQLKTNMTGQAGLDSDSVKHSLEQVLNAHSLDKAGTQHSLDAASNIHSLDHARLQVQRAMASEAGANDNSRSDAPLAFSSPQEFVDYILPLAKKLTADLPVEPKFIASQAALETGWGKHMIKDDQGNNSFNLFGIKSDQRWDGAVANVSTLEYRDGVAQREQAAFRAYGSYEESLKDYVDFIRTNDRYQPALEAVANKGGEGDVYLQELQAAGYATDPAYASKISAIARLPVMADRGEER